MRTNSEASVIEQSGQARNRCIVLFNGTVVDTANPSSDAFSYHSIATSLFNIPRWNGHLRLSADWNPDRVISDGNGEFYTFYSVMSHCVLVASCVYHICLSDGMATPDSIAQDCYLHEIPEMLIGDIPGPFKRPIKPHVRPIEDNIMSLAYKALNLTMPDESQRALIKRSDIMAQDIEAYFGIKKLIRGVTLSNNWSFCDWMSDALRYAARATPADFIRLVSKNEFPTTQKSEKNITDANHDIKSDKRFIASIVKADVIRKANMPSWDISPVLDVMGSVRHKNDLFSYTRIADLLGFNNDDSRVLQTIQWLISISRITPVFYFNDSHLFTLDDVDDAAKTVSEGLLNALNGVDIVDPETGCDIDINTLVRQTTILFKGVTP